MRASDQFYEFLFWEVSMERGAVVYGVQNRIHFCNHVTIIPAIKAILDSPDLRLDGFIGPGHVSMVIGMRPYTFIARDHGKPLVIAGFEPLDIVQSIYMIVKQISEKRTEVENQSAGFILEEGFSIADLRRIVASMAIAAKEAGVAIVAGDTKVVQRGKADGVFINTAGIGIISLSRRRRRAKQAFEVNQQALALWFIWQRFLCSSLILRERDTA